MTTAATLTVLPATLKAVPDNPFRVTSLDALETSQGVAFVAEVERDGEKVGTIENQGSGGPTTFYPAYDANDPERTSRIVREWETFVATVPDESLLFEMDGEMVVATLRDEAVPELLIEEYEFAALLTGYVRNDSKRPVVPAGEPVGFDKPLRLYDEPNILMVRGAVYGEGGGLVWDDNHGKWVEVEGATDDADGS